uniref:Acyl-CoA-binding domain-containing protein 6 n=1 Tax=Caenorhabditis japonica TaxID=281687 RepID=A0A8R1HK27_CAEJA
MFVAWATVSFQRRYFQNAEHKNSSENPIDPRIEAKFDAATTRLPALLSRIDQKTILTFYGLYKQAIEGPADPRNGPYWYETVARKKFNAWLSNGQMRKAEAMEKYCEMISNLDSDWDPNQVSATRTGGWEKMPSTMGVIEPEMFDDVVIHEPTRLETDIEKQWFAAMRNNDVSAMKSILGENSDILEAKDQHLAMTALLWATDLGCESVVGFLIDQGADVNAVDGCLQTPLHFAAQCHRPLLAEILIQAGADKKALDADGMTPFECCEDVELKKRLAVVD